MKQAEDLNEYQPAYYDTFKFYDENTWYLAHYANRLCKVLRNNKFEKILSLGIGHQTVSKNIINEFSFGLKQYHILEGSKDIIDSYEYDEQHADKIEITNIYFENFETSEQYDVIEMGFVLEHVDDPDLIVKKYKQFLKPGGVMFMAVPNARSLHRLLGHKAGLLDDMYKLSEYDLQLGHKRYFDLDSLKKLATDAGLNIQNTMGLMLKPITGAQLSQLGWDKNEQLLKALFEVGEDYPEIANCMLIEATV